MFPYDQLPPVPDLSDQIERTNELIGRGGYGSVYKGRWLGAAASATPAAVAIKIIEIVLPKDKAQRTKRFKEITRELSLWCSIQHENILPLSGIARINGDANVPAFVSPWMENGNAKDFCSCNPRFPPIFILYDIINGLHYLHTYQPEIVHGDIKADNVLINNSFKACLCDFGLSRLKSDNTLWKTAATHAGGTVRWMAPELINGDAPTPTKKSDIYAYAMTCYEILSGDVPFKSIPNDIAIPFKIIKGQRPDRTESFYSDSMWDIITRCWEQEPEDRIPTEMVLWLLRENKEVEEALAKIGEKNVALANFEKEMAVLKEHMAKTEEDLKALKEEKEKAEEEARHGIAEKERELNSLNASLQQSESAVEQLKSRAEWLERTKEDVEEKYERRVEALKEQLEDTVAMHQTEAAQLRQETERATEGSSILTKELMSLWHTNSSLREEVERLKYAAAEARAQQEKAVVVQQKQQRKVGRVHEEAARVHEEVARALAETQNEVARLHEEVARALAEVETTSGNLEEARIAIPEWRPYPSNRSEKSLVIGIDVGTTFSGVSFAFLEPRKVPRILPVRRFPGQRGNSKVPSAVCYDQDGHIIAVGPETNPEVNPVLFKIKGVRRAEWLVYDMKLRPRAVVEPEPPNEKKIPLPVTDDFKTAVQVFADFLQYLFKSAKEYIIKTARCTDPTFTWSSIQRNIYLILTHPNGWERKQQSQMLDAAVAAGIVDRPTAANRITFLTEGKAYFHFCLARIPRLHLEDGIVVVDCGNETIDIRTYSQIENSGYKEIASLDCLLPGFMSVTSRARDNFKERFKGSKFGSEDDVEAMARALDRAKYWLSKCAAPYYLQFGGIRDFDKKYGVYGGKFKVNGTQMAGFFEPVVKEIIFGIEKQAKVEGIVVKFVWLIGQFARSDYLYTRLSKYFKSSGIVVLRPDAHHIGTAVLASGAVHSFVDRFTSTRIPNCSYGIEVDIKFNPADPEHVRRERMKFKSANGDFQVPGGFLTILEKGTIVTEETQFRWPSSMYFTTEEFSQWSKYSMIIKCYKGQAASSPQWLDLEPDSFHDSCMIHADMTDVKENIRQKNNGTMIYQFDFEVVVFFGVMKPKAYIAWKENGEEKRKNANISYVGY